MANWPEAEPVAGRETSLTPERWRQVRRIFDVAVALQGSERAGFLAAAWVDDDALRAWVEHLLSCHEEAGTFIDRPLVNLGSESTPGAEDEGPFEPIGPYAVERILGSGGMGTVYLAHRADQAYRRSVAIKILRRGLDSADALRRFRDERQILADLDHPNIARLYEGGTTAVGLPYLVMEYVEGQSLELYCATRRLGIGARLRLFRKVCRAVQFAHKNLVVHRDLKPGNILVTAQGEPKLLDFGIAKLLDRDPRQRPLDHTLPGQLLPMTLAYASPEQVRGETITTASDVYSLGVVLYELLTGRQPHVADSGSPPELLLAISEKSPERPSSAVARWSKKVAGQPPSTSAEGVVTVPDSRKLHRLLRGDLDNIVLAALRKDPARRYGSVEELSRDIWRYQNNRPVVARSGSAFYRAGRFLRRHRLVVGLATAALVALIAFLVTLGVQRGQILLQKLRAEEVTRMMIDLFAIADPDQARGEQVTAREIMDRGAREIPRRLRDQPRLRAELLQSISGVYLKLGLYEQAEPLLEDALSLKRQVYEAAHPAVVDAVLLQAELLLLRGDYSAAQQRYREILDHSKLGSSADLPVIEQAVAGLAQVARQQGDYKGAEELAARALAMSQRLFGEGHPRIAANLRQLGDLAQQRDDHPAARQAYGDAMAIYRELYGDDHPEVIGLLADLATVLLSEGEYGLAEEKYRKVVELQRELYGASHPSLATTLTNLASLLHTQARSDEAELLCREALEVRRQAYGDQHPKVAASVNLLGLIHHQRGDLSIAESSYREALAIWRTSLGDQHPEVAVGLANLASVLQAKGEEEAAEALLREALGISRTVFGEEHRRVASILHNLGSLLHARDDDAAAASRYQEALGIRQRLFGRDHPEVAQTTHNLAGVLRARGEYRTAETLYREALRIYQGRLGEEHPNVALVMQSLALTLSLQGRPVAGERLARRALEIFGATLPEGHLWSLAASSVLGDSLTRQQRYSESEQVLLTTYDQLCSAPGDQGRLAGAARQRLVDLYQAWGRPEQAEQVKRGGCG